MPPAAFVSTYTSCPKCTSSRTLPGLQATARQPFRLNFCDYWPLILPGREISIKCAFGQLSPKIDVFDFDPKNVRSVNYLRKKNTFLKQKQN